MNGLLAAVIGLFVVGALAWYIQTDGSLILDLFDRNGSSDDITYIDEKTGYITPEVPFDEDVLSTDERALLTCTAELAAQDCSTASIDPVCSIDQVIPADKGGSTAHYTEYISACHYCKFFGTDQAAEFGDQRVVSEGYRLGRCSQ